MTRFTSNLRNTVLAVAAISLVVPQIASARGLVGGRVLRGSPVLARALPGLATPVPMLRNHPVLNRKLAVASMAATVATQNNPVLNGLAQNLSNGSLSQVLPQVLPVAANLASAVASRRAANNSGDAYAAPQPQAEEVAQPEAPAGVTTAAYAATPEGAGMADLVLEDVELASPATRIAGPAYRIMFRNQGTLAAGAFRVGLMAAVDGKLAEGSPRVVAEITGLQAGEAGEVTLRLPLAALSMQDEDGEDTEFTSLFVGIDTTKAVPEADETNNLAAIERDALEPDSADEATAE